MNSIDQVTHLLADRIACPEGSTLERRAQIEATLLPMVRVALRTGQGHPRLVQWVRRTLPWMAGEKGSPAHVDPEQVAAPMARLLCQTLLQQMRTHPDGGRALDTVVGL
jgi:hypothetical protein